MSEKALIVSRLNVMRTLLRAYEGCGDVAEVAYTWWRIDALLDAYNDAKPERCAVCWSTEVVYHNYQGTPFCCPCAACCPPKAVHSDADA